MGRKEKKLTTIGLMAGSEVGADFFSPWRAAKARKEFVKRGADLIIFLGSLLNIEALNQKYLDFYNKKAGKNVKTAKITADDRRNFCAKYLRLIFEDVLAPVEVGKELIKYWVFPCPLFELKKDKYGLAAYIYDNLRRESEKISGKGAYVYVGSEGELVEIEDDVAIRTLGIITPSTTFFRAKILSAPIEREITYRQLSSVGSPIPDLYLAGSFAASLNEMNPRTIPLPRPYVSIPSLSIKFTETVLQNTLGFALLKLYPADKNRAQYKVSFYPLDDALELECRHVKKQIQYLPDANQKKVAEAIVDKVRLGTKVTLGKIEGATGLQRAEVLKAIKGLKKSYFQVDVDLGEVKNPHKIIPKTKRDLTEYRDGKDSERVIAASACLHIPDNSVDYDFLENDLPAILCEEKVDTLYFVGDITEGNKYRQDRKGQLLDRFNLPQDQKKLAGYLIATRVILPVFKKRYEETSDLNLSLIRTVVIPGNHDEGAENEPPLKSFQDTFLPAVTDFIYGYLASRNGGAGGTNYHQIRDLVQNKMVILENPSIDGNVGMLHEYSQSAEQSTGKAQKAIKQFMALSDNVRTLLLANHHEQNFSIVRIGDKTIRIYHLGTYKRFYSYESQRSKISEFGIAVDREVFKDGTPVRIDTKFIPSRVDFRMKDGYDFMEKNRIRGIRYYEELKAYSEKGYTEAARLLAENARR